MELKWTIAAFFSLAILWGACSSESGSTQLAFYHWQTRFAPDSLSQVYLQTLGAKRIYLRFFDVDWDYARQEATPKAMLRKEASTSAYEIVPTVFITNRTMENLTGPGLDTLVQRLPQKIKELWPGLLPAEIQIDCDWTKGTRENYFRFLRELKQQLPASTQLSVTLRLHQYRYPEQTGVPPADRAMLMFYNMGDLTQWEEPNSILNPDKAKPYLAASPAYPLPLDLALPLFRWGVLFRDGKMIKLINGLHKAELLAIGAQTMPGRSGNCFSIPKSTYLKGYYLYAGDQIRLEYIRPEDLLVSAEMLRSLPVHKNRYLSFYHLAPEVVSEFEPSELKAVLDILQQDIQTKR